jgi:amino acid transporter
MSSENTFVNLNISIPDLHSSQYVSGAAQVVDVSRVVFAFARDNALPGSRYWKKVNRHTQTPVNAVWFVCDFASLCVFLKFSETAFTSLAG